MNGGVVPVVLLMTPAYLNAITLPLARFNPADAG